MGLWIVSCVVAIMVLVVLNMIVSMFIDVHWDMAIGPRKEMLVSAYWFYRKYRAEGWETLARRYAIAESCEQMGLAPYKPYGYDKWKARRNG